MFRRQSSMRPALALVAASLLLVAYSSGLDGASADTPRSRKSAKQHKATKTSHTVRIDRFLFEPPVLTVRIGDTVEWKNAGSVPHTATSTDGKTFDSSAIASGRSWSFKPKKKGTFNYVCTLHPNMKGKLIVH
jgi:plastocyanin